MEQSKWIIVRRESTFAIFKRKLKKLIFNFFGIEEVEKQTEKKVQINRKNIDLPKKEITIEIIA